MRILHVNDVASVGSILVAASGDRDVLYQPALKRQLRAGRTVTARLVLNRARDWCRIGRLRRCAGVTHLHVHYGSFASLALGRRFSLHLHGEDALCDLGANGVRGLVTRWAVHAASQVVVSTPNLLEPVRRHRPDVQYVPNPMPVISTAPVEQRHAWPHVLVLSKLDRFKGWDRQLEVIRALRGRLPEMRFEFLAHGNLPPAERRDLVDELIRLGGSVRRAMPRSAFLEMVREADFAVGQMEVGALGMSELEAMAMGVPVIGDAGAHVAMGCAPPLIAPSTAPDLVAALWSDQEALAALVHRTQQYIVDIHCPEEVLRRLESILSTARSDATRDRTFVRRSRRMPVQGAGT